jgi:hypothetical protein
VRRRRHKRKPVPYWLPQQALWWGGEGPLVLSLSTLAMVRHRRGYCCRAITRRGANWTLAYRLRFRMKHWRADSFMHWRAR